MVSEPKAPPKAPRKKPKRRMSAKTQASVIKAARRRTEALDYRVQGYTFEQIGDAMGISDTRAFQMVTRALAETKSESVEELRKVDGHRLNLMTTKHMATAVNGDLNSGQFVLRIMERRARLFGLDAPERKELTGKDGQPIETKTEVNAASAFAALYEGLVKAGIAGPTQSDTGKPKS